MKRKSKSIGLYRYLFLAFTVLAVTNTTKHSSCDVSTCKSMVQWCLIKGGPAEIGKLKPQEDDNCRNCDPEAERKANNGECPCCEVPNLIYYTHVYVKHNTINGRVFKHFSALCSLPWRSLRRLLSLFW